MKSSLAFMGAVLVAFATGALLIRAIENNDGTPVSHPAPFADHDPVGGDAPSKGLLNAGFAPDSSFLNRTRGVLIPNLGQVRHDVYFQFIGPAGTAYFRAGSIGLLPRKAGSRMSDGRAPVNLRFVGANRRPEVSATAQADDRLSYPIGAEDADYSASVPLFKEITYDELYEGIDMQIVTSAEGVFRRFTLAPGARVDKLLLHYEGAAAPDLFDDGHIEIEGESVTLTYAPPSAYQKVDGVLGSVPVRFAMGRFGSFGFRVGGYDPALPLVIEVEGV